MNKSRLTDLLPPNLPLPPTLEEWRQTLLRQLPPPITGEQTLFVGEPLKVIIAFDAQKVEVLLPQLESTMSSVARLKPISQGVIPATGSLTDLQALIERTMLLRMKGFRECSCCGQRVPQESLGSLHGQPACRRCLEGRRFLF